MNPKVLLGLRILLGLVYAVFGLNYFLQFIPNQPMAGDAGAYAGLLYSSKILLFVKILEVVAGVALLANQYSRLAAIILAPISVNILLFHLLLAGQPAMAIIIVLVNASILYGYKDDFSGALKRS